MSPFRKPPWLTTEAADAIRQAARLALSRRLDGVAAAREVAWSRHPALPARMISEAVAAVIADGEEYSAMGLSPDLTPAESADLQEAIHYALRFNDRGKPIGVRARDDAAYMAKRLLAHLERAEFAVMKRPPIKPHSVG